MTPLDQALLEFQAKAMQISRQVDHAKSIGREIEALSKQVASLRLAEGKEAYIRIEGVEGIVRQNPDGTMDIVEVIDGKPVAVRRLRHLQ